jgi:hypothetical protein
MFDILFCGGVSTPRTKFADSLYGIHFIVRDERWPVVTERFSVFVITTISLGMLGGEAMLR